MLPSKQYLEDILTVNGVVRSKIYTPVIKHNGKSPFSIGNTSSKGPFPIAMLDYRSVYVSVQQCLFNRKLFESISIYTFCLWWTCKSMDPMLHWNPENLAIFHNNYPKWTGKKGTKLKITIWLPNWGAINFVVQSSYWRVQSFGLNPHLPSLCLPFRILPLRPQEGARSKQHLPSLKLT